MSISLPGSNDSPSRKSADDLVAWSFIVLICLAAFLHFATAFNGQNLHVWGDEVIYRIDSMRKDFSEAYYPVYIFLWTFSHLPHMNGAFPEMARVLNAALLALAVPFIYATCRLYTQRKWSVLISGISIAGPLSTYSAYFMPDASYFSVFCIFAWFCLRYATAPAAFYGALAGVFTACMSMIKPHGVFVLVAFMVSQVLVAALTRSVDATKNTSKVLVAALVSFIVSRGLVGWYFGGVNGFGLFGGYSEKLDWQPDTFINILKLFLISLTGHAVAVGLLTGPTAMAFFVGRKNAGEVEYVRHLRLRAFAGCMLVTMFAITILFTTKLAEGGHASETVRLHMRYYNLFFPLSYLVLASQIGHNMRAHRCLWVVAALLVAFIVSVQLKSLTYFVPLDLDAPELRGILKYPIALSAFIVLSTLSTIGFIFRPRYGAWIFLCAALPFLAITSSVVLTNSLESRSLDDIGDAAGKQIGKFLGADAQQIGLFGDVTAICQAMFYAGNPTSFLYPLPEGVAVPNSLQAKDVIFGGAFPNGRNSPPALTWAVVFGNHSVPANFHRALSGNGWSLFKVTH